MSDLLQAALENVLSDNDNNELLFDTFNYSNTNILNDENLSAFEMNSNIETHVPPLTSIETSVTPTTGIETPTIDAFENVYSAVDLFSDIDYNSQNEILNNNYLTNVTTSNLTEKNSTETQNLQLVDAESGSDRDKNGSSSESEKSSADESNITFVLKNLGFKKFIPNFLGKYIYSIIII